MKSPGDRGFHDAGGGGAKKALTSFFRQEALEYRGAL